MDDDEYEGDTSVTIRGELPDENYYFNTGKLQKESEALEALIPDGGEVEDYEDNPALEKFRRLANVYHDIYNNGGWQEGRGQLGSEMEDMYGLHAGQTIDTDDLEEMVDEVTYEAWEEQLSKGVVSEEILMEPTTEGEYGTMGQSSFDHNGTEGDKEYQRGYDDHKERNLDDTQYWATQHARKSMGKKPLPVREDDFGAGEVDMGDDVMVSAGDLVQVDDSLGGEATVVAQREGYIVVKLPKGGMKLLRDDEWWIQDDSMGGGDDDWHAGTNQFEDTAQVMPQHAQDDRQNHFFSEGYTVLPPMDPKYIERDGLEGPFRLRSGKVYYYDASAGKNYDPDTDMYMSDEDWFAHDADPNQIKPTFKTPEPKPAPAPERGRMDEFDMDENVVFAPYEKKASGPIERGMKKGAKWIKRGFQWGSDDSPNDMVKRHQEYDTDTLKNLQDEPGTWKTGPAKLQQKIIKRNLRKRGERDFEKYMGDDINEVWMPQSNDRVGINRADAMERMRRKMDTELGHENEWNNYAIFIDGKHWKTVKNEGHAKAIIRTLLKKGKKAEYKFGAYPLEEGKWDYKDKDKGKGPGYSADGDGGAKNRKNRKAFRKAEKKKKHQAMMRGEKWAQEKVTEGGMPSGVIKSKMRYAEMTDEEFAAQFGERTEENLRQMAWRHGYGKMSPHYWNRVQRGQGLEETIVAYNRDDGSAADGEWLDDESGQIFQSDEIITDPDTGERREKTPAEIHAADRAARPEHWAQQDKEEEALRREMDAELQAWQDERNNPPVKKLGWDAIGDFGDVAAGGGDPMDYIIQKYGFRIEDIDAEAVNQGYEDAYEWAGSYADLPTEGIEEGKGTHRKGYKSKGGDYTRPKDAKNARAGAKYDRKKAKKDTEAETTTEGMEDMNVSVQSWGNKGDDFHTEGRITIKTPGGKTYAFDTEDEAIMHFGVKNWKAMKNGERGYKVTFPVNEFDSATISADDMRQDAGQDRELGNPVEDPAMQADPEAELAGMQELIKNVLGSGDKDIDNSIDQIANPADEVDQQLGKDEVGQLRNLLGMFK